jgi:hypothetical protein
MKMQGGEIRCEVGRKKRVKSKVESNGDKKGEMKKMGCL